MSIYDRIDYKGGGHYMVNQIYRENEMEEKIEKKMQVISGGSAERNGIYFSKLFGVNAFEKMVELIN